MKRDCCGHRARSPRPVIVALAALSLTSCRMVGEYELRDVAPEAAGMGTVVSPLAVDPEALVEGPVALPVEKVPEADPILHSSVSLDPRLRETADAWVFGWTGRRAGTFREYLARMRRYEAMVDAEIETRGLPPSLRYLPIVESGYSPSAISRAGATGLWQLTDPTARDLGLEVGAVVDERHDPVASTDAALSYLSELHREFGSWFLALAAYNGGPGRVRRLLERHAPDGEASADLRYLAILPHLPSETREFVPRLLAAAALAGRAGEEASDAPGPGPILFDEVTVPDATSLDVVAEVVGVDEAWIRQLNPQFVKGFTPIGEATTIRVPAGAAARFERGFAAIPPEERLTLVEHVVEAGETLTHIARRYGVRVSDLTDVNRGLDPRRLRIGATVVVPLGGRG